MSSSIQLGYPDVPKSITNPKVKLKDALDVNGAIPFLTFIKIINVNFEPDNLQNYYTEYLKSWNNTKNGVDADSKQLIVERYRDFIKELNLNYTTNEERRFLSKIDYADPLDLDIAIGFYGRKLKDLALYYNNKRSDIKFNTTRNKLIGTNYGIEKAITELTLSYLSNLDDGKILYDFERLKYGIEVEIEELYDTYPLYFNQTPDPIVYDKKDLSYGYNLFLTDDATTLSTYLSSYSKSEQILKELDDLLDNKRAMTQKYISTDFYYLSTGNVASEFLSGKLFDSVNPSGNFLNRDYPTTASTKNRDYLLTPREKGFFKPTKTSIILLDGLNSSYKFNFDQIKANSLYFFPDPTIIGSSTNSIITFTVDDSHLKNNFSSGNANNRPSTSPIDTKYYGYVSKIDQNKQKYLDSVYERGFVEDSKRDIYGNLYGLFKNDFRFKKNIAVIDDEDRTSIIFNGHKFYDDLYDEGYNFDYTIFDDSTYSETIRSGLSTVCGDFTNQTPELTMYFGQFKPYTELVEPTDANISKTYVIYDGGYILKSDGTRFDDPVSSNLSTFESSTGPFYYTELIEGGLHSSSPIQRALLDPLYPSLTSNIEVTLMGDDIRVIDGGRFELPFGDDVSIQGSAAYDDTTINPTTFNNTLSSESDYPNYQLSGSLLIKNSYTNQVSTLLDSMPYLESKYGLEVVSELESNVLKFEVVYNTLIIETPSYLTLNKITFDNGTFNDPKNKGILINLNQNLYNKVTNRFKVDDKIIYVVMNTLYDSISSNDFIVYPEIHSFDMVTFDHSVLFPSSSSDITSFFGVSGGDVRYDYLDTPRLAYNSRNNIYNVSYLLKSQSGMPRLDSYTFSIGSNVTFLNRDIVNYNKTEYSNILSNETLSTFQIFLSGGPVIVNEGELII